MSKAKEKYIYFIQEHYVPVFYRDYYLDAVCDGRWDVILYEENDKITAAYIFMIKQKMGMDYIIQPQLCPYTGPVYFNPSDVKQAYTYLVENLPKHQLIIQNYFHSIPIIEQIAYTHLKKHTYLIDKAVNVDELWMKQSSKHRKLIEKAEQALEYKREENVTIFTDFVSATFRKRNKKMPFEPKLFKKLDLTLSDKGLRKIVKCTDNNDSVVAMGYFIIDEKWTYNFANAVSHEYSHNGMHLILWQEIKTAVSEARSFDFEGSVIPGIDQFYKRFKGTKTIYQSREKSANKLIDLLVKIKMSTKN